MKTLLCKSNVWCQKSSVHYYYKVMKPKTSRSAGDLWVCELRISKIHNTSILIITNFWLKLQRASLRHVVKIMKCNQMHFFRYLRSLQDVLQAYLTVTHQEIFQIFVLLRHISTSTSQLGSTIKSTRVTLLHFTTTLAFFLAKTSANIVVIHKTGVINTPKPHTLVIPLKKTLKYGD